MKTLLKLAFGAALIVTPVLAQAQSLGIDFANMPVGTKMSYKSNNGGTFTDTFVGKRGRFYVVNRVGSSAKGQSYWEKIRFDKNGRRTSYSWGDNTGQQPGKIFFKPFDCEYTLGACKMRRKLVAHDYVNNGSGYTAQYNTQKFKDGYKVTYKRDDQKSSISYTFKLGKYNLRTEERWGKNGKQSIKLVKIH